MAHVWNKCLCLGGSLNWAVFLYDFSQFIYPSGGRPRSIGICFHTRATLIVLLVRVAHVWNKCLCLGGSLNWAVFLYDFSQFIYPSGGRPRSIGICFHTRATLIVLLVRVAHVWNKCLCLGGSLNWAVFLYEGKVDLIKIRSLIRSHIGYTFSSDLDKVDVITTACTFVCFKFLERIYLIFTYIFYL